MSKALSKCENITTDKWDNVLMQFKNYVGKIKTEKTSKIYESDPGQPTGRRHSCRCRHSRQAS
jgi:hypothetical protein